MFGRNPFNLKGDAWKIARNQMTSGLSNLKIKALLPVMEETSIKFVNFLANEEMKNVAIDAKEVCAKFTTENVISCAFGIEANCFKDDKAEFRKIGRKIMSDIVQKVLKYRQENSIKRNDYLNSLLEIKTKYSGYNDEDVTAHIVGLFLDGFETSSSALSFVFYELAANLNVQEKLRQEIHSICKKQENIAYEDILTMPYLDAVLMETLRLHTPVTFMVRDCTKPFKLPSLKNGFIDIPLETNMIISTRGLHLDTKHFPDPNTFKPERFMDKEKQNYHKYAFMPFGEGPRICAGMKFAVCQVKMAVFHVVKNYEITVNKKTIQPLQVDESSFLHAVKGGLWLNFNKI